MFYAEKTHSGQYKRYGDSYYEWDVRSDEPTTQEEVTKWCMESLLNGKQLPEYAEWSKNIRMGGEKQYDMAYYFAGYYTMKEWEGNFHFTVCKPYTD